MNRNEELDGLRGLVALAVVIYHGILVFGVNDRAEFLLVEPISHIDGLYRWISALILIVFNGETAVMAVLLHQRCGSEIRT